MINKQISAFLKTGIAILFIITSYACNKCNDKPINNVKVRIQNNLDLDINSVLIGSTMYKSVNSYASCSMTKGFKKVKIGETTAYTQTYGNHLGYRNVRIDWVDEDRQGALSATAANREIFDSELIRNGAIEDSVANVYNGNITYGLRLPDGDYTFVLKEFTTSQNPTLDIDIIKD